jgi:hypothetical protein
MHTLLPGPGRHTKKELQGSEARRTRHCRVTRPCDARHSRVAWPCALRGDAESGQPRASRISVRWRRESARRARCAAWRRTPVAGHEGLWTVCVRAGSRRVKGRAGGRAVRKGFGQTCRRLGEVCKLLRNARAARPNGTRTALCACIMRTRVCACRRRYRGGESAGGGERVVDFGRPAAAAPSPPSTEADKPPARGPARPWQMHALSTARVHHDGGGGEGASVLHPSRPLPPNPHVSPPPSTHPCRPGASASTSLGYVLPAVARCAACVRSVEEWTGGRGMSASGGGSGDGAGAGVPVAQV